MIEFKFSYFGESFPQLLQYLPVTVFIIAVSLFFGTIIGFILVWMKLGRSKVLRKIGNGYTTVVRCTPYIVMLFLIYYGVPRIVGLFGVEGNSGGKLFYIIMTFSIMCGGTLSEVMRSAYEAVPKGQTEAAYSLSMTPLQTLRRIIIPQAFVIALPNIGNNVIDMFKNSSLAFTIGFMEIMGKADSIIAQRYGSFPISTYLAVALIYWVSCIILEKIMHMLETRLERRKTKTLRVRG